MNSLSPAHYVFILSAIVVVLALALRALGSPSKFAVPALVLGILGGMGFGVVVGFGLMAIYGDEWNPLGLHGDRSNLPVASTPGAPAAKKAAGGPGGGMGGMMGGMGGMMGGGGGGMGGGMGGMMGGGGRGPNPKNQLATLITKLEQLSGKPLSVTLTDEQKKTVAESLKGLEEAAELTAEDAKTKLDALLKLLESQRETLEAAGYRWPGGAGGGFQPPADVPNPFKEEANAKKLKSLLENIGAAQKAPAA